LSKNFITLSPSSTALSVSKVDLRSRVLGARDGIAAKRDEVSTQIIKKMIRIERRLNMQSHLLLSIQNKSPLDTAHKRIGSRIHRLFQANPELGVDSLLL